jgi:hypothetical protein
MRGHDHPRRQVLRGQVVADRARHGGKVGDTLDRAEFLLHVADEQVDLLGARHTRPRGDQMTRMGGDPPVQHRDLVGGQRPALQPAADGAQDGVLAHRPLRRALA